MFMTLNVILEKMPKNRCAYTPDGASGVIAVVGKTPDEALLNFRAALTDHLSALRERGLLRPEFNRRPLLRATIAHQVS